jgi:hypothetical protein
LGDDFFRGQRAALPPVGADIPPACFAVRPGSWRTAGVAMKAGDLDPFHHRRFGGGGIAMGV